MANEIFDRDLFLKQYYEQHKLCPKCKNPKRFLFITLAQYIPYSNREFKDLNRATCKCGWIGTVHELIPG